MREQFTGVSTKVMLSGQKSLWMVKGGRNIQRPPCPAPTVQAGLPRARWLLSNSKDGESMTSRAISKQISGLCCSEGILQVPSCAHCLFNVPQDSMERVQLHLLCTLPCGSWFLHILRIKEPPPSLLPCRLHWPSFLSLYSL